MSMAEIAPNVSANRDRRALTKYALIALGAVLSIALLASLLRPSSSPVFADAKPFTLTSVSGNSSIPYVPTAGRPAIINFFASWCLPCRRELPRLAAEHAKVGSEVDFIGVDHQDSRTSAQDLLSASGVTYSAGYDPSGTVAQKYGITTGLPATVFVGRDGKIVHIFYGEMNESQLQQWTKQITGSKS